MSLQKTKIFFSKNTKLSVRHNISGYSGFEEVLSLRRYLGVPFFTGRIKKISYAYITDNFKLASWHTNNLRLVGRITLANSVLTIVANYSMQSITLPVGFCAEIDSIVQGFIWGTTSDCCKINLVD